MGAGRDAYRLGLVLEGEYHGLREVANFGVLYNNTQDLLTQDLARILVLDIRSWGGGYRSDVASLP